MWKDFFYYSKRERRAIYVLMVLIALFLVGIWIVPQPPLPLAVEVVRQDSFPVGTALLEKEEFIPSLFPFDPNTADSTELSKLGLSPFVVRNVLKYRDKGGIFATAVSFSHIYGLAEEKYKELEPYIRISTSLRKKTVRQKMLVSDKPMGRKGDTILVAKAFKYPEGTLVDVNSADTTELKKIPGIGSGIAKAIVGYRSRLGGFYALEQLKEIKYVTPDLLKWFKLDTAVVPSLNINEAGLDKLRSHPYLNFYQAKVIVEHRRKRGAIKSLSQLALYEEFTEKDLVRLSAYVAFD